MYMCKMLLSNRQKLKTRKCDLHEISSASRKAFRRRGFVTQSQFLVKFMSFNKGVKLKFHAPLAKTSKNSQILLKRLF